MEEIKEAALLSFLTPFKNKLLGSPGGPVVKNLPCNARRQFDPWSRRIPHAAEQLGPCATTTEPVLWRGEALTLEAVNPKKVIG